MKLSSNFIFVKEYYRAQEIMENWRLSQQQVPLVIESKTFPMLKFSDATPSSPLVLSTSHITASIIRQMKLWVALVLSGMINPPTEIAAPTKKRQRFKNYFTANQAQLLPLLLAYVRRHLQPLEKLIEFSTDGSIKGQCVGFAVTLAEAIAEDQLDATMEALDYLFINQEKLQYGQWVAPHNELNSIITSIVKKQSINTTVGKLIGLVDFDDSIFSKACQKMVKSGETLIFSSNHQDDKKNHAVAVTLRKRPGNKRQYYLIDANGAGSKIIGSSQCCMVEVTDDPATVQEFVKLTLNLCKGMTVYIRSLPLNPVISYLMAKNSPDDVLLPVLTTMLHPILSCISTSLSYRKLLGLASLKTRALPLLPRLKTEQFQVAELDHLPISAAMISEAMQVLHKFNKLMGKNNNQSSNIRLQAGTMWRIAYGLFMGRFLSSFADTQESKPVLSPEPPESTPVLTLDSKESTTPILSMSTPCSPTVDRQESLYTSYMSSMGGASFIGSLRQQHSHRYDNQSLLTLELG